MDCSACTGARPNDSMPDLALNGSRWTKWTLGEMHHSTDVCAVRWTLGHEPWTINTLRMIDIENRTSWSEILLHWQLGDERAFHFLIIISLFQSSYLEGIFAISGTNHRVKPNITQAFFSCSHCLWSSPLRCSVELSCIVHGKTSTWLSSQCSMMPEIAIHTEE